YSAGAKFAMSNATLYNQVYGVMDANERPIFNHVKAQTMSIQAFESYLVQELTQTVVETIDHALVNGTGVDQGQGILTGITWDDTNSVDLTGNYTDLTKALGLLKRGYSAGAKFAMSNATLYNQVYGVMDANERPIFNH
ncbi:phage major capsid protein, partial [Staphylococcus aureus]